MRHPVAHKRTRVRFSDGRTYKWGASNANRVAFRVLEKPAGTLDLLLYLLRHGTSSKTVILGDTGMNKGTFYRAAKHLVGLGYLYEDPRVGYPSYAFVGLTKSGEAFAQSLLAAEEMLATTVVSMERELDALEATDAPESVPRRVEVLATLANMDFDAGRWDAAVRRAGRLADLAHGTAAARAEAQARLIVGGVLQKRDRHDEARRELNRALSLADAGGAHDLASEAEYLIGSDLERQGHWARALERFAAATERAVRADSPIQAATAKLATARVHGREGRHAESYTTLREVVGELEGIDADEALPRAYGNLGATAYRLGRDDAASWYEKAIESARRVADPRMEAYGMANAAAPLIDHGEYTRAETYLRSARKTFEELEEGAGLGTVELNTAYLHVERGEWTRAEDSMEAALRKARETGNRYQEAFALFLEGRMMARRDRAGEARDLLERAKRMFEGLGGAGMARRCDEELRGLTGSGTR